MAQTPTHCLQLGPLLWEQRRRNLECQLDWKLMPNAQWGFRGRALGEERVSNTATSTTNVSIQYPRCICVPRESEEGSRNGSERTMDCESLASRPACSREIQANGKRNTICKVSNEACGQKKVTKEGRERESSREMEPYLLRERERTPSKVMYRTQ